MRLLGGYFVFGSPDAALLVSLLPTLIHVRGADRLSVLVRLVDGESADQRPGRELVLTRLVEVLPIEALRATSGEDAPPGLLGGLADAKIAIAIRQMHAQLARSWTVAQLAKKGCVVTLGVLRALHAHGGHSTDGVPAGMADGCREGTASPSRSCDR